MHSTLPAILSLAVVAAAGPLALEPRQQSVGQKPALGWSGWNQGGCNAASASVALTTARNFVSRGLKNAGYTYVNIDDCWSTKQRDSSGNLVPDPAKWPNGIKAVSDEIHNMGLKFGLYGDNGIKTCAGYPGSQGNEQKDARLLASWGVDFWKYDNCYSPCNLAGPPQTCPNNQAPNSRPRYETMRDALKATGRPILYSLCNWGYDQVWTWGAQVGQMWRMSTDNWGGWQDVVNIANWAAPIAQYSKPYAFNDLDMMIIGNGKLTAAQERTHFAIWAIAKSPIILGTDISKLSSAQIALVTNKDLLAVNQDSLGVAATTFTPRGTTNPGSGNMPPYWAGALSDGTVVALVASTAATTMSVNFSDVPGLGSGTFAWKELFTGKQGTGTSVSAQLEKHDVAVFKVKRV
ncbi:alpha-galactosidase [Colletotrichum zoysiae]|uniref:Alpha-galactosidase n=1 Tax=Colletotrichum zoysiae TaxID=1216348 RepID=A0AAD9M1V9_9PEZI|nr:alpha-galactosidase [Colletotrichum zoysiae]